MMRHVPTGYADSKLAAAILNRELAERYKVSASMPRKLAPVEVSHLLLITEFPKPTILCDVSRFLQDGAKP